LDGSVKKHNRNVEAGTDFRGNLNGVVAILDSRIEQDDIRFLLSDDFENGWDRRRRSTHLVSKAAEPGFDL
jgi:hypothetical protein